MSSESSADRRSIFGPFKVEVDFTNRQIMRVVWASLAYTVFATFLLGVFYTYVLNPAPVLEYDSPPSLFSFPSDFANQWSASGDLRAAVQVWIAGTLGMTALFAIATGVVLSRKIAGPLHRVKSDLRRMKEEGRTFDITLRDGDELMDMVALLNETLSTFGGAQAPSSSDASTRGARELADEDRMSNVAALRAHLATMPGESSSQADREAWSSRMTELLDKTEASLRS